jgi:hypothetical protein
MDEYDHLLLTEEFAVVRQLGQTTFEKGIEKGRAEERRDILCRLLERRFGSLSQPARTRLAEWPFDRLGEIEDKILLPEATLVNIGLEDAPNGAPPPAP